MTEQEWLASTDPAAVLLYLRGVADERKLRLFGAACCRGIWDQLSDRKSRRAVEVAERHADGQASDEEVLNVRKASILFRNRPGVERAATLTLGGRPHVAGAWILQGIDPFAVADVAAERSKQCALLRDLFGNPFRPPSFSAQWRTDTAIALARQMYEAREFSAMPILADALQDAGCDSDAVLNHCRDTGVTHVRGCWVVDLVLRRE